MPVVMRSEAWVCGSLLPGVSGSNPVGGTDVSFDCCLFSGRGLCVWLTICPEESYPVLCV